VKRQREIAMQITINGTVESIRPCTLADLVKARGLNSDAIVIEYNQVIVKRDSWAQIQLRDNDHLELLSFVGGG
jgi:thiamine biosynthesis protein ThiS